MIKEIIVPCGWKKVPIFEAAPIISKLVDPKKQEFSDLVLIAPNHIESRSGQIIGRRTAKEQNAISGKYLVHKGDVIYSKIRPYLMKTVVAGDLCLCSADMYPLHCTDEITPKFLHAILLGDKFTYYANSCSARTGIPKLNRKDMGRFTLLLPTLPEQKAIADLLSTWDKAIEKTERLIQVKEKQFRWLLKELILQSRDIRSNAKWKMVRLGEIGEIKKGKGITKKDLREHGVPCIRYAEIYTKYHFYTSTLNSFVHDEVFLSAFEIKNGDVLFAASGETQKEIGKSVAFIGSMKACSGGDMLVLRTKVKSYDPKFLGFALNHPAINKQKSAYAHGNSVVHLYGKDLVKIEFFSPPLEEQRQIAETLSTAQQEIDLLKQLVDKYKTQKRGLMHKILTGEWRIKPEIIKTYTGVVNEAQL